MRCPFCLHPDSKVLDSRQTEEGGSIRRRRECTACHRRFTTYERVDEMPFLVVKRMAGGSPSPAPRFSTAYSVPARNGPSPRRPSRRQWMRWKGRCGPGWTGRSLPPILANWSWTSCGRSMMLPMCVLPPCTASSRMWTASSRKCSSCGKRDN